MKLWKSKKSATTSCVSAVSGKLNLSGNKNGYKDEDQVETIASSTPTNQSNSHLPNGLHQGEPDGDTDVCAPQAHTDF